MLLHVLHVTFLLQYPTFHYCTGVRVYMYVLVSCADIFFWGNLRVEM